MKASDLRIGNIVSEGKYKSPVRIITFFGSEYVEVDAGLVNFATDDLRETELTKCEPIPLTASWLLKFGFEKSSNKNNTYMMKVSNKYFFTIDLGKNIDNTLNPESYYFDTIVELKTVDQLQNLYHAITGSDLLVS